MMSTTAWDVSPFPPQVEVPLAALLQFERTRPRTGSRARAVRQRFGISEVRYVQLLNRALDDPKAREIAPELITRLKAERQARRELRERACAGRIA